MIDPDQDPDQSRSIQILNLTEIKSSRHDPERVHNLVFYCKIFFKLLFRKYPEIYYEIYYKKRSIISTKNNYKCFAN
jgi:hypothetical protein